MSNLDLRLKKYYYRPILIDRPVRYLNRQKISMTAICNALGRLGYVNPPKHNFYRWFQSLPKNVLNQIALMVTE